MISAIRNHYEELGADPRPGVTLAQLAAFEAERGLLLPPSVAHLYLQIDGLAGETPEFGYGALQLWPLAELTRISEGVAACRGVPDYGPIVFTLRDADEYLAFGDGMCWSHVLAVRLTPEAGPVLWICGANFIEVAPDFDEFWRRYLADPMSMLWPEY